MPFGFFSFLFLLLLHSAGLEHEEEKLFARVLLCLLLELLLALDSVHLQESLLEYLWLIPDRMRKRLVFKVRPQNID